MLYEYLLSQGILPSSEEVSIGQSSLVSVITHRMIL